MSSRLLHNVISLCKRRGFIFQVPGSAGDGGGAYAYGPLGAELKRNLVNEWWHAVVTSSENVHALDSGVLTSRPLLEAATEAAGGASSLYRVSQQPSDSGSGTMEEGKASSSCHDASGFFLRPHIRQGAVLHFLQCAEALGLRPPFGLAETGKVFNTEPTSRHFIFKLREFESVGMQFFCPPSDHKQWYSHWQKKRLRWWKKFANSPEAFSLVESASNNLPVNTERRSSIEFTFPWGSHDVESITNRGHSDLQRLSVAMDTGTSTLQRGDVSDQEKALPHMLSLAAGVDRAVLAYLVDAFTSTKRPYGSRSSFKTTTLLKLHTCLAPYKVAVLPRHEENKKLYMYCRLLAEELRSAGLKTDFCAVGSFEERLMTQDECGTPYRVIADEATLESGIVSVQERNTTAQEEMNGRDVLHSLQRVVSASRLN